jgi:hypothetical protein
MPAIWRVTLITSSVSGNIGTGIVTGVASHIVGRL